MFYTVNKKICEKNLNYTFRRIKSHCKTLCTNTVALHCSHATVLLLITISRRNESNRSTDLSAKLKKKQYGRVHDGEITRTQQVQLVDDTIPIAICWTGLSGIINGDVFMDSYNTYARGLRITQERTLYVQPNLSFKGAQIVDLT